uniref:G_PROTEIN_RECEP_F1_2 domain-containing protein n=1 Tax=Macrostomum lignano TaxID=282301 RepID=A0A1I8JNJ2_9PLAT
MAAVCAMGLWGQLAYLGDSWNRLDFFIVIAGVTNTGIIVLFSAKYKTVKRHNTMHRVVSTKYKTVASNTEVIVLDFRQSSK